MSHIEDLEPRDPRPWIAQAVRFGPHFVFGVAFLLGCALVTNQSLSGQQGGQSQCLPADEHTSVMLPVLDSIVNGTAYLAELRDSLNIPAPKSTVSGSLVTRASICSKAAALLDSLAGIPPTNRNVYVYKLEKIYAVDDPLDRAGGERDQISFFTSKWVYLSTLAY